MKRPLSAKRQVRLVAHFIGETSSSQRVNCDDIAGKRQFALALRPVHRMPPHTAEDACAKQLRKCVRLQDLYEHHRNTTARQHHAYQTLADHLEKGNILARIDYEENNTVPFGFVELGPYGFARNRRDISILGGEVRGPNRTEIRRIPGAYSAHTQGLQRKATAPILGEQTRNAQCSGSELEQRSRTYPAHTWCVPCGFKANCPHAWRANPGTRKDDCFRQQTQMPKSRSS
jgi:hypothetical protein